MHICSVPLDFLSLLLPCRWWFTSFLCLIFWKSAYQLMSLNVVIWDAVTLIYLFRVVIAANMSVSSFLHLICMYQHQLFLYFRNLKRNVSVCGCLEFLLIFYNLLATRWPTLVLYVLLLLISANIAAQRLAAQMNRMISWGIWGT